jgi:hypothetical protein
MTHYYFDLRDKDGFTIDDEGFEVSDLEAVQREAVLSLPDHSRDAAEKAIGCLTEMAVAVRDDAGPVMEVSFNFQLLRRNRPMAGCLRSGGFGVESALPIVKAS